MPLELQPSSSSSAPVAHLKRSFAQQAYAYDEPTGPSRAGNSPPSRATRARDSFGLRSDSLTQPPTKFKRLERNMPQQSHKGSLARSAHQSSGAFRSSGSSKSLGRRRVEPHRPSLSLPIHTEAYITATFQTKPLKSGWIENAKSAFMNWASAQQAPHKFESSKGNDPTGKYISRCIVINYIPNIC